MSSVVLVVHLILALALIMLVLLQRSEGGGLGIGGGSGGMGGLASAKGTANMLTRLTAICAFLFFCTSLTLGILSGGAESDSILDNLERDAGSVVEAVSEEISEAAEETKEISVPKPEPEAPKVPVSE